MILSETQRRWYEIRFFSLCQDLYHIRKSMVDVMYAIDTMAQISDINVKHIKIIAGKLTGDPYYQPTDIEICCLGKANGHSLSEIGKMIKKSRGAVQNTIDTHEKEYAPYPRLPISDDTEIYKFMQIVDTFKKAGI